MSCSSTFKLNFFRCALPTIGTYSSVLTSACLKWTLTEVPSSTLIGTANNWIPSGENWWPLSRLCFPKLPLFFCLCSVSGFFTGALRDLKFMLFICDCSIWVIFFMCMFFLFLLCLFGFLFLFNFLLLWFLCHHVLYLLLKCTAFFKVWKIK